MSNNNNVFSIFVLIALGVIVAVFLFKPSTTETESVSKSNERENQSKNEKHNTIGSEWQWSKKNKLTNLMSSDPSNLPFTADSVYRALQAVKLNESGDVILDHDALLSLDEALERIHNRLDSESLATLQALIKNALPGKAGEQTAALVADYYEFLQAKQEFSQINEAMADSNNELTNESIEANQALYNELQELREIHIGSDATKKLFRISDANAQYMFDSMKLESNSELSDEEKLQRRNEIKERHISLAINIAGWPERYQAFKSEKQAILESSLSQQQKEQRLKSLLNQSFNEKELKQIDHLGLNKL